jgi:aminoglycoside phosphotransferase (APT) family kinase protein
MISVGQLVAVGRTSDVYAYGHDSVVKVPRPDVPGHWAGMEAEFTTAVRRLGVPAPEVRDLVQIEGRQAIVFERVSGESLWQKMVASPHDLPALTTEFADLHQTIFSAGLPVDLTGSVDRICTKLSEAQQLSNADRDEAQRLARSLPRGAALLHGDFHPGNVLLSERGPVVIDWFDSAIGHPNTDVIRTSLLLRSDGRGAPPHLPDARPEVLAELLGLYITSMIDVFCVPEHVLQRWESVVAASRLAEDAESDSSALIALWEGRDGRSQSPLVDVLSAVRATRRDCLDQPAE